MTKARHCFAGCLAFFYCRKAGIMQDVGNTKNRPLKQSAESGWNMDLGQGIIGAFHRLHPSAK